MHGKKEVAYAELEKTLVGVKNDTSLVRVLVLDALHSFRIRGISSQGLTQILKENRPLFFQHEEKTEGLIEALLEYELIHPVHHSVVEQLWSMAKQECFNKVSKSKRWVFLCLDLMGRTCEKVKVNSLLEDICGPFDISDYYIDRYIHILTSQLRAIVALDPCYCNCLSEYKNKVLIAKNKSENQRKTDYLELIYNLICSTLLHERNYNKFNKIWWKKNKYNACEIEVVENGHSIVFLSDMHIANTSIIDSKHLFSEFFRKFLFSNFFLRKGNKLVEGFSLDNLEKVLTFLEGIDISHLCITGDISNLALHAEFSQVHTLLLKLQNRNGRLGKKLDPNFLTVLPGNHDVTGVLPFNKYRIFKKYFGYLFDNGCIFPNKKVIKSRLVDSSLSVSLIMVDSCVNFPVHWVGVNARGTIKNKRQVQQLIRDTQSSENVSLVLLHHNPVMIPLMKNKILDYFMRMRNNDANDLLALCCEYGVAGIFHGHQHCSSIWQAPKLNNSELTDCLPIIGCPCTTRETDDKQISFFQLKEILCYNSESFNRGLGLWRYFFNGEEWQKPEFINVIFLASQKQ